MIEIRPRYKQEVENVKRRQEVYLLNAFNFLSKYSILNKHKNSRRDLAAVIPFYLTARHTKLALRKLGHVFIISPCTKN